jgi:hypothetical protein
MVFNKPLAGFILYHSSLFVLDGESVLYRLSDSLGNARYPRPRAGGLPILIPYLETGPGRQILRGAQAALRQRGVWLNLSVFPATSRSIHGLRHW